MQLPGDHLAQWLSIKHPVYLESFTLSFNLRFTTF